MTDHDHRTPSRKATADKLQASLLDRLCPRGQLPANNRRQRQVQMTDSIRRDLELLLNTRLLRHGMPESLRHVRYSVVNYGLVDIASRHLHSEKQCVDFARELATAIARFEPRLRNVRVSAVADQNQHKRFRIDAELAGGFAQEPVCFESELEHRVAGIRLSQVLQ